MMGISGRHDGALIALQLTAPDSNRIMD